MNSFRIIFLLVITLTFTQTMEAQTDDERAYITKDYDVEKLINMSNDYSRQYYSERQKAVSFALKNDIEIIIKKEDGGISILQKILEDGTPIYIETYNAGSASTINTDQVYEGGSNGLSLSGKNITFGIWDGGLIRGSHQELAGRVTQLDDAEELSSHATHVSGTLIASGINPEAKGMSFEGELLAYDFNNSFAEITIEASNGMLLSNHSYGFNPNAIPETWFGAYLIETAVMDNIIHNASYYLPVFAAGNSRGNLPPYNPDGNGYDLISGYNLAKNILSVANVKQVDNYVDNTSVEIWDNSSWGPTDDGRIKPDISAKGRSTFSSDSDADDDYSNKTGTSMAAPAVCGSIGLLHEHYNNLYNGFLTAASMKALVIHSAREAGDHPGPDYVYGWGLMDTSAAANLITNQNFTTIIEENTLNEGDSYSFTVNAINPETPLVATLAWTDPAGPVQDVSFADDRTPRLVNDLDIKITGPDGSTEFLPWTLSAEAPAEAATKGNNIVDNVEKVEIENAEGEYTIEISHKGNLQDLLQNYTIIVSGIAESDFAITTDEAHKSFCGNEEAIFNINLNSIEDFDGDISLSQSGLPEELNASFSPSIINSQGQSVLSIDNLSEVEPGEYPFTVAATSGSDNYSFEFTLNIKPVFNLDNVTIFYPINPDIWYGFTPELDWSSVPDALTYEVQLSTSSNFQDLILTAITEDTVLELPELDFGTRYYWRVRPLNECVNGPFTSNTFVTMSPICQPIVYSTDTPINISSSGPNIIQSVIPVNSAVGGGNVVDVNVHLELSHTRLSDLIISLTSPDGTVITLLDQACGDLDDLQVIFDDKGTSQNCDAENPITLTGTIKPEENLSLFENEFMVGDWILTVEDLTANEGGSIDSFGLVICSEVVLSVDDTDLPQFSLYPNPSEGLVELSYNQLSGQDLNVQIIDLNGRILEVFNFKNNSNHLALDLSNLSSGIYFVSLNNKDRSVVKKLILK